MADWNGPYALRAVSNNPREEASKLVGELFKLLPSTSGIMLALIWGLADRMKPAHDVLVAVRVASIFLVVTILLSLLGIQFMISTLQSGEVDTYQKPTVQACFVLAWLVFIGGSASVIWSLFLI